MSTNCVSVLIPVFGVEKYIEKCVHSLFSQTFEQIEFVFVDDCTKDGSVEKLLQVLELYPARKSSTRIIKHEKNRGVAAARQTAIDAATGDYLLFIDSDDYIEKNMVELMYEKSLENNADIVFCQFFSENPNNESQIFEKVYSENKIELINISFSQPAFWNKMIRRKIITENKIRIEEGLNYGEDLSVVPRIIYYAQSFACVDKPLYHYVKYNADSYTASFTDKSLNDTLKVTDILSKFFTQNISDTELYKNSILLLKAVRKAKILRSGRIEKSTMELFPEINVAINKLNIDLKTKVILMLATYHQKRLLQIFVRLLLSK